jgi:hypothetical protein
VETSPDLRHFNALANPRFVITLLTPGGDMSLAPGQEARLHLGGIPTRGIDEHLYVLLTGHQSGILFQTLTPFRESNILTPVFLYYYHVASEYINIFSGEKEKAKSLV